ncbi:DUF4157 domain-containing protein [Nannocystis sp. SCPEA4]|uniref:eCIS core domain-containing protein n=1 Tax=Nannocystis sp. SCPEA4 TaxID=2996787 RepID=UPI00226EFB8A
MDLARLSQVRAENGYPLPSRVRGPLEAALGHDLSSVRIHIGALSDRVARSIGAEAFTSRNDIVFARDRYQPSTPAGLNLLAHELVHTIQQRSTRPLSAAVPLPVTAAPVHVQARMAPPSEDSAEACRSRGGWADVLCESFAKNDESVAQHQAFVLLVQEIDRVEAKLRASERWDGDPESTTAELAAAYLPRLRERVAAVAEIKTAQTLAPYKPRHTPDANPDARLEALIRATLVRLRTIELRLAVDDPKKAASTALIEWQHSVEHFSPTGTSQATATHADLRALAAEAATDRHAQPSKKITADFTALEDLIAALDLRRRARRQGSQQGLSSLEAHFAHLQEFTQAVMDDILARASKGDDIKEDLRRLHVLMLRLDGVLGDESAPKVPLGDLEVESTKDKFPDKHSSGQHADRFGAKPTVTVSPYSVDAPLNEGELKHSLRAITRTRLKQLTFLAAIYGARLHVSEGTKAAEDGGADPDALDDARASLASFGTRSLRLHSDSDWRAYLLKRFKTDKDLNQATDDEAYRSLVDVLRNYFDAFTVHSPYNIEDFGDSYLDRDFPRALSGQLVHDCGVYALRIAYMLTLLRKELGLTFHFVRLPFHFALVVRARRGLPTLVVNNNDLEWVEDSVAQELVAKHNLGEAQLAGELASHHFAPGARMPFFTSELGAKELDKTSMWREYRDLSAQSPFTEPAGGRDLKYLEAMRAAIDAFNTAILPVWNSDLPQHWLTTRKQLQACRAKGAGDPRGCEEDILRRFKRAAGERAHAAMLAYEKATATALQTVPHAQPPTFLPVSGLGGADSAPLAPGLAAPGARESHPEQMLDTGLRGAAHPSRRIEELRFLIISVMYSELDMDRAVVQDDSFLLPYADHPVDRAKGVRFTNGEMFKPADYRPPFSRLEYRMEKLHW